MKDIPYTSTYPQAYSDCYFVKTKTALVRSDRDPVVIFQVFQKNNSILAGMEFVKTWFLCKAPLTKVRSLEDGDAITPFEPVLEIETHVQDVVELETIYLGILARCTRVATNVRQAVIAANGKPVLFFPARFDVPEVQYYDGYAAKIGGAFGCSTLRQMHGFGSGIPVGTQPHAAIAAFGGSTVDATLAYAEFFKGDEVWSLVDFENDCAKTAVEVAQALKTKGFKLTGVRLDTSEKNVDFGVLDTYLKGVMVPNMNDSHLRGVCPALVNHVRKTLDTAGFPEVKICVSGGFTPEKVAKFEDMGVPVDVYAIGETFIKGSNPFTSDITRIWENGAWKDCAKVGRGYKESERLKAW